MSLARLDMLPAHCSIVVEPDDDGARIRFYAINAEGRRSMPSGWFPVADSPIYLSWTAFEFEEDS